MIQRADLRTDLRAETLLGRERLVTRDQLRAQRVVGVVLWVVFFVTLFGIAALRGS